MLVFINGELGIIVSTKNTADNIVKTISTPNLVFEFFIIPPVINNILPISALMKSQICHPPLMLFEKVHTLPIALQHYRI